MAPASSDNKQAQGPCGNAPAHRECGRHMADLIIVYWRDIPAQVIVKKGRQNAKRELPLRFTEAIDMCAMRTGAGDTDAYLAEWRKADPVPVGDDLEAEADKALADIDATIRQGAAGRAGQGGRQGKCLSPPGGYPGHSGQAGSAEIRLQAGRRVAAAARPALLRDPAVVGAPFAGARMVLCAVRRHVPAAASAVEGHRLRPRRRRR